MMRACAALAVLGLAAADSYPFERDVVDRRLLRGGAGPAGRGGFDLDICADGGAPIDQQPNLAYHGTNDNVMRPTGTIHDDSTDRVDCSTGQCSGLDTGANGYSDNVDCHKTIVAPPGNTISLTFSHMALEAGQACGAANGGVGCDIVTLYDGADINAPVIGVFSGTDLPAAQVSSANLMTVRFQTDAGNYGFQVAGVDSDPGFYADWHFIDHLITQGDGICPAPAVYTDPHGTIHDDERSAVNCVRQSAQCGQMGGGDAGYEDNTNCYTTIHAPTDTQVRLTFTQMNLELQGCNAGQPNGGCPEGGCDYVSVYDGQLATDPLIGKFSGYLTAADLPSVVSTGEWLRIEFHTDVRNCGISNAEDPGWFADWDFVENGQDICHPDSAVLRTEYGVIHDDDVSTANSYEEGGVGYGDNLDCGVRIRGAKGSTVNFHVLQMSLEGDGYGICDPGSPNFIGHSCDENGGDFLYIYDGRDDTAPLLAQINGSPTDQVLVQDSWTSTGRDLYLRFTTDAGNYGLTGTTGSPGFYAEWRIIDEGQECDTEFTRTPGMGLRGHNNEQLSGMTPEQCEVACCAREWCKSFDFIASMAGGTCNLADVDATTSFASTGPNQFNDLYEMATLPQAPAAGGLGANGCAQMLQQISGDVNHLCCPNGGCARNMPDTCSEDCASRWLPFVRQCSEWLKEQTPDFSVITMACEREEYGRYRAGSNHGRCSDGDLATYTAEFAPACCGDNMEFCPTLQPGNPTGAIVAPESNGVTHCSPDCAAYAEEMYTECHPRFETMIDQASGANYNQILEPFIGFCQGLVPAVPAAGGGGHRRAQGEEVVPVEEMLI